MTDKRSLLFYLCAMLLVVSGCSSLPITGPLPDNLKAELLGNIDAAAPFAVSPDGNLVAYGDGGVQLLHLPTREKLAITPQGVAHIAWSPLGFSLAATFYHDGKSTIMTYDQYGIKVAETVVSGRITSLEWLSENELVTAAVEVKNYKFGSNYKSIIHRWQPGRARPVTVTLRDTTLRPATASGLQALIARGPMLAAHPQPGLLLYLHPNDPPVFNPYCKLYLRDLANNRELEIAQVGLNTAGGRFSADGELVYYGNGETTTTIYNPWTEETIGTIQNSGKNLELAPTGGYWFADGTLYQGETVVARLAPEGVARFTADGRRLIVAAKGKLYLLTGLTPAAEKLPGSSQSAKLSELRTWRIQGLITAKEYKESLERIRTP